MIFRELMTPNQRSAPHEAGTTQACKLPTLTLPTLAEWEVEGDGGVVGCGQKARLKRETNRHANEYTHLQEDIRQEKKKIAIARAEATKVGATTHEHNNRILTQKAPYHPESQKRNDAKETKGDLAPLVHGSWAGGRRTHK